MGLDKLLKQIAAVTLVIHSNLIYGKLAKKIITMTMFLAYFLLLFNYKFVFNW